MFRAGLIDKGIPTDQRYWLHVWAGRGLFWVWVWVWGDQALPFVLDGSPVGGVATAPAHRGPGTPGTHPGAACVDGPRRHP